MRKKDSHIFFHHRSRERKPGHEFHELHENKLADDALEKLFLIASSLSTNVT